jgi:hypothetical protein
LQASFDLMWAVNYTQIRNLREGLNAAHDEQHRPESHGPAQAEPYEAKFYEAPTGLLVANGSGFTFLRPQAVA